MCNPCNLQVEWDTGVLREAMFSSMEYVVLATDYTSTALVCSCQQVPLAPPTTNHQSLNLGFGEVNRRSCDFLMVRGRNRGDRREIEGQNEQ